MARDFYYENHLRPSDAHQPLAILPLFQESLGHYADAIPDLPGTLDYCPQAHEGLVLGDYRRQIAPVPGSPDFLMRWASEDEAAPKSDLCWEEEDWRALIEKQAWHFQALEEAGLRVLPHRHSHILFEPDAGTSTLYTIVPNISELAALCPIDAAHGAAMERWMRGLIDYSKKVIDTGCPEYLMDIYVTHQYSLTSEDQPLLHDIDPWLENLGSSDQAAAKFIEWAGRIVCKSGQLAAMAAYVAGKRRLATHLGGLLQMYWTGSEPIYVPGLDS